MPELRDATHLIVPIPAAEPVVSEYREHMDPAEGRGVPAHLTIMSPFRPLAALRTEDFDTLHGLFADARAIFFSFDRVGRFESTLYLAPDVVESFAALTRSVWKQWPEYPPYGGAHPQIVPHLTVATGHDWPDELARKLRRALPINAAATEVWLLAPAPDGMLYPAATFALGTAPESGSAARKNSRSGKARR